jgi:hypothetical protein
MAIEKVGEREMRALKLIEGFLSAFTVSEAKEVGG